MRYLPLLLAATTTLFTAQLTFAQDVPLAPPPVLPSMQGESGIVAVVNDEVISTRDLNDRLAFVFATTQLEDFADVRARLIPQVLRTLLDEKLRQQEAERNSINVSDEDVAEAIAGLEQQRGMMPGEMLGRLNMSGVPQSTFMEQIRTQLLWNRLVMRKIRPEVKISDDEVERERSKLSRQGTEELQIEQLALPVDRPENDAQVKALAEKLASGIRSGAPFESVARELGAPKTQAQDIKPVWVTLDELDPAIAAILARAPEGAITDPVRTPEGYSLVKLLSRRKQQAQGMVNEVALKDMLLKPANPDMDPTTLQAMGAALAAAPGSCTEDTIPNISAYPGVVASVVLRRETLETMDERLRNVVGALSVGGVSEPYITSEGVRLFLLCERLEKPGALADAGEARQRVFQRKMELAAEKYVRQLRRDATIDIRLGGASE
jgi:peptidyl-prolyl cis-trans isomerase SurA